MDENVIEFYVESKKGDMHRIWKLKLSFRSIFCLFIKTDIVLSQK